MDQSVTIIIVHFLPNTYMCSHYIVCVSFALLYNISYLNTDHTIIMVLLITLCCHGSYKERLYRITKVKIIPITK